MTTASTRATALVATAAGLAAAGAFTPRSAPGVLDAKTLVYQASQALDRVQPGDIQFRDDALSIPGHGIVGRSDLWERLTGHGSGAVQAWRHKQLSDLHQPGHVLVPYQDESGVYRDQAITGHVVDYTKHEWWADNRPYHSASPPLPSSGQVVASVKRLLRNGTFYVIGRVWLHGQQTLEIARHDQWVRIWLNPRSYLIVQVEQRSQLKAGGMQLYQTNEYSWLPPTKANLAQLVAPIPPGFRKVPGSG